MLKSPLGRAARSINMVELGKALTEVNDPPVKALLVYNSNPAAVCPEHNLVVRGLKREDLFTVVHEQFFTDTTDYADILLAGDDVLRAEGPGQGLRSLVSAGVAAGH